MNIIHPSFFELMIVSLINIVMIFKGYYLNLKESDKDEKY